MEDISLLIEYAVCGILKNEFNIENEDVLGIYDYGSTLYGTLSEKSDADVVVVVKSDIPYRQYESEVLDIHIMSSTEYERQLKEHKIMALECYFQENPIKKYECEFVLSLPDLRREISSIVSNSWVKAKKKMLIHGENYIGIKSLFHSFRILNFGTQIARHGKIVDYESCRQIWSYMLEYAESHNYKWLDLEWKYKQPHLLGMTTFRALAPKEKV